MKRFTFDPSNGCLLHPSDSTSWFRKGRNDESAWVIYEWAVYLYPPTAKAICDFLGSYQGAEEINFIITKDCKVKVKN
jgi:hypothetical protein